MERNDSLIRKKIYKYMLTGVMTTIALQLGNVVDAMIVGNLIGSIGNSAVSAAIPYVYLLQAAAILFGTGGAVSAAVLLGKRDTMTAGRVMGFCLAAVLVYPLFMLLISPAAVPAYVQLTHADGELKAMITDTAYIYSFGMPVISAVIGLAYFINVDNHPALAAKINISANAVNLVLDFLLVRFTTLGIKGAALSTVLGYIAAGLVFIPVYIRSSDRMLKPVFRGFVHIKEQLWQTVRNGFPNLVYLIMTIIGMYVINAEILSTLGSGYFSAYAVTNNTQHIVQMFLNGISSVIASVAGVLYGEKDYYGMRSVLKRTMRAAMTAGAVIMAVFLAVPQFIARMYGFDIQELMPDLMTALRVFSLSFGFFVLNAVSQNYYRTVGQTFLSAAGSAMELLLIKMPLMIAGMKLYGFTGLFAAMIISEALTFAILNMIRIILQKAGKIPQKGFMAIPERNDGEICDITVTGSDESAVNVSERIIKYCLDEGMSASDANAMGIAAEEIVSNIGKYGYSEKDKKDIDICLSKTADSFYMRIRDDGIPFDPVSYKSEEKEAIGGLDLIRKLAVKISYMRTISLNNTIIEIRQPEGENSHA